MPRRTGTGSKRCKLCLEEKLTADDHEKRQHKTTELKNQSIIYLNTLRLGAKKLVQKTNV